MPSRFEGIVSILKGHGFKGETMIRYKVIRIITIEPLVGCSCYATGKYQLKYKKNTIVTAKEGTLGIAVFEKRHQAEDFIEKECFGCSSRIIRVSSIGHGKRYRFVCPEQDAPSLDNFYHRHAKNLSALLKAAILAPHIQSPPGTIFYQQVKVLLCTN